MFVSNQTHQTLKKLSLGFYARNNTFLLAHRKTHQLKTAHRKWALSCVLTEKIRFLDY